MSAENGLFRPYDWELLVPDDNWWVHKHIKLPLLFLNGRERVLFDPEDNTTYKLLLYNPQTGEQESALEGEIKDKRAEYHQKQSGQVKPFKPLVLVWQH